MADNAFDPPEPAPPADPVEQPAHDDRKWPVAMRAIVITGSAAALWGMIWLTYRIL